MKWVELVLGFLHPATKFRYNLTVRKIIEHVPILHKLGWVKQFDLHGMQVMRVKWGWLALGAGLGYVTCPLKRSDTGLTCRHHSSTRPVLFHPTHLPPLARCVSKGKSKVSKWVLLPQNFSQHRGKHIVVWHGLLQPLRAWYNGIGSSHFSIWIPEQVIIASPSSHRTTKDSREIFASCRLLVTF